MPLQLKVARTAREIDDVFRFRRAVIGASKPTGARLYDRFDTFPITTNFIAYVGGAPEGSLRVTLDSSAGFPGEDVHDMRVMREVGFNHDNKPRPLAFLSYLCVHPESRLQTLLVTCLLRAVGRYLKNHDVMDVVGCVAPEMERHMGVGVERLGGNFHSEIFRHDVFPFYGSVDAFSFAQFAEPSMPPTSERLIFSDGDVIFVEGSPARNLYVVARGKVEMTGSSAAKSPIVVHPGEMFGEDVNELNTHACTAVARGICEVGIVSAVLSSQKNQGDTLHDRLKKITQRLKTVDEETDVGGTKVSPPLGVWQEYVLGRVVMSLSRCGFFAFAAESPTFTAVEAASALNIPEAPLKVMLNYLAGLGSLEHHGENYRYDSSTLCKELDFMQWLMGGYDPTLVAAEEVLQSK